jgi:MFS family permease
MLFLMLGGVLFWACMASLLPSLPTYIQQGGATSHEVGIVMGAFAVGLLLFRPQVGKLVDRRGRKVVLLLGVMVAGIAPLCYGISQNQGWLIAVRMFHGLSIAAFTTSYSALVADLAPAANRGEVIGYMSLVNPIGMAIGPALGGSIQPQFGYQVLFGLSASLASFSLLFCSQVKAPAIGATSPSSNQPQGQSAWHILTSEPLRVPTFTMLTIGLAFGILSTYVPLYIQSLRLDFNVGLFYTIAAITSFSLRWLVGRSSDRLGRGLFITLGLLGYMLSMLWLWQARDRWSFVAAGVLEGCGGGMFLPMMITLITDRSHPTQRGRVFSLCIGGFDLGIALAGPCVGFIADWAGYRNLFGVATLVTLISVIVFSTLSSKDVPHSIRFAWGQGRDVYALPPT